MPSLTLTRSPVELAQQRSAAEQRLVSRWPQAAVEARAFLDTHDWVRGQRDLSPVSKDARVGLGRERLRAADVERQRLVEGRREDALYAGFVALVLGWLLDPSYPETPFM